MTRVLALVLSLWLASAPLVAQTAAKSNGNITATAATCASGVCVTLSVTGLSKGAIQVTNTFAGTLSFEGSVEGGTFVALQAVPLAESITPAAPVTSTTRPGRTRGRSPRHFSSCDP